MWLALDMSASQKYRVDGVFALPWLKSSSGQFFHICIVKYAERGMSCRSGKAPKLGKELQVAR